MNLRQVSEVKLPVQGVSMDYLEPYLAIAIECAVVFVYQKSISFELICLEQHLPMIDLVKWFETSHLLLTTFDGVIIVFNFSTTSKKLSKSFQIPVHCSSIKSLLKIPDFLITCSLDNRVSVYSPIISKHTLKFSLKFNFEAHKGWVHGMTSSSKHLVTQGENLIVSFWDLKSFEKVKQVEFIQSAAPCCLTRPICIDNWVLLANTFSQIDGEPCLTLINEDSLQVIEISFQDFSLLCRNQRKQRKGEIQVQGSLKSPFGIIIFAVSIVLVLDLKTFQLKHRVLLEDDIIVSGIQDFCPFEDTCLVLTTKELFRLVI
jgi:WD40 repeat protein